MTNPARPDGPTADPRHLLVIGAGPDLGGAIAPMRAAGGGTILFTGGGWADHPALALGHRLARQDRAPAGGDRARCRPGGRWHTRPASPSPGRSGRAHRSARTRLQKKYWSVAQSHANEVEQFLELAGRGRL